MSRIYWDTMLFVYLIESQPEFGPQVNTIKDKMKARGDTLLTSTFTVGELLTGFHKRDAATLAAAVRKALQPPWVELLPLTAEVAERYAQISAVHNVSPADAIHLASAATASVNLFLTNDQRLTKLTIPGIDFLSGLDMKVF